MPEVTAPRQCNVEEDMEEDGPMFREVYSKVKTDDKSSEFSRRAY